MRNATIKELLLNLRRIDSLKAVCGLRGIRIENNKKRKKYFIELILGDNNAWNDEQKRTLVTIFNREMEGNDHSITAHFFRSEGLSNLGVEEIRRLMGDSRVMVSDGRITSPGFDNIRVIDGVVKAIFKGNKENFISVGEDIIKEIKVVQIPTDIIVQDDITIMRGSGLSHIRVCRDFSHEALGLEKLRYAIPEGINSDGVESERYNLMAKNFVDALTLEVINGVFLKIGDQTTIKRIDYRARGGNILNEAEIKRKIREGALIVGLKGFIRHNNSLVEFIIKWGHLCTLRIHGKLNNNILEEILIKIYRAYKDNLLQ